MCNEKNNIWSIGEISYLLMTGENLFSGTKNHYIKNLILISEHNFNLLIFESLSS
jgi:hypothetical protein